MKTRRNLRRSRKTKRTRVMRKKRAGATAIPTFWRQKLGELRPIVEGPDDPEAIDEFYRKTATEMATRNITTPEDPISILDHDRVLERRGFEYVFLIATENPFVENGKERGATKAFFNELKPLNRRSVQDLQSIIDDFLEAEGIQPDNPIAGHMNAAMGYIQGLLGQPSARPSSS